MSTDYAGRHAGFKMPMDSNRPAPTGMYVKDREVWELSPNSSQMTAYSKSWQNAFNGLPENEQTRIIKSYCEQIGKDICWQISLLHNELLDVEKRLSQQILSGDAKLAISDAQLRSPQQRGRSEGRSESPQRPKSRGDEVKAGSNGRYNKLASRPARISPSGERNMQGGLESGQARVAFDDDSSRSPREGRASPVMRVRLPDSPQLHPTMTPNGSPPPLPPIPNKLPDDDETTWAQPPAPVIAETVIQTPVHDRVIQTPVHDSGEDITKALPDTTTIPNFVVDHEEEEEGPPIEATVSYRRMAPPSPREHSRLSLSKRSPSFGGPKLPSSGTKSLGKRTADRSTKHGSVTFEDDDHSDEEDGHARASRQESTSLAGVGAGRASAAREPLRMINADSEKEGKNMTVRGQATNPRHTLVNQILDDDPNGNNKKGCMNFARELVGHPWFEYGVACLLILNAVSIGYRAEYRAQNPFDAIPSSFTAAELIFGILFTAELCIRIAVFRCDFLRMKGWEWNLFDLIVVSLQFVESIFDLVGAAAHDQKDMKHLSILRMLRLGRIVRLLRMVRLVPALKSMVYLIAASMQSFFWTVALLALLMFGIAVHFTEIIADHREDNKDDASIDMTELEDAWGGLSKSIQSLYQAILGGIDWKDLTDTIDTVSWSASMVFAMYIAFASLVMLNLVTGVFVEGAQRIVADDRDAELVKQARKMFAIVDDHHDHQITWHEFAIHLEDPGMAEYFRLVGMSRKEAKDLFQLLDHDHSGTLSIKEFVHGCLGLRGPAKSIDLARLAYNHELQGRRLNNIEALIQSGFQINTEKIVEKVGRVAMIIKERRDRGEDDRDEEMMLTRSMPSIK